MEGKSAPDRKTLEKTSIFKIVLEKFNSRQAESLLDDYHRERSLFEEQGNFYANSIVFSENIEKDLAIKAFSEIQGKKLFNAECLWRAGKLNDKIESTYTFAYYKKMIHNCPFITAVTKNEVDAYKEYLFDLEQRPSRHYSYNTHEVLIRAASLNEPLYPGWFKFFDKKFNTVSLVQLTDIRGGEEKACIHKFFEKDRKEVTETQRSSFEDFGAMMEAFRKNDYSGILLHTDEKFYELAKLINDYDFANRLSDRMEILNSHAETNLELDYYYLEGLMKQEPPVKKDYANWQDGISDIAWNTMKFNVIKMLDPLFNDYEGGWKPVEYSKETIEQERKELEFWENAIREGRKQLNAEG